MAGEGAALALRPAEPFAPRPIDPPEPTGVVGQGGVFAALFDDLDRPSKRMLQE
ncbi:MAG: hypothetical protein ABIY46_07610 [Gemmatimonadales bacterium]